MITPQPSRGRPAGRGNGGAEYGGATGADGGDGPAAHSHVHIPDSFVVAPRDVAAELNSQADADADADSARFLVFHLISGDRERLVAVFDGRCAYTRPPYEQLDRLLSVLSTASHQRSAVLLDRHTGTAWLTTVQEGFQFVSSVKN
jgi:hypothetical protein